MNFKSLILKPRMSEKSYDQSHSDNTFTFDVPINSNKVEVVRAVEAQYSVNVVDIRMMILKGKLARSIRIGGTRKNVSGKRPDIKKAYVKLAKGDNIPIFAKIDEDNKKQEKLEEKLAKKAEKSAKPEKPENKLTSKLPFRRKKKGEQ